MIAFEACKFQSPDEPMFHAVIIDSAKNECKTGSKYQALSILSTEEMSDWMRPVV